MTANEMLNKYLEEYESGIDEIKIKNVVLDILKYLDYKESGGDADPMIPPYYNLWKEISMETDFNFAIPKIELPKLRQILERYKILGDEKDGM